MRIKCTCAVMAVATLVAGVVHAETLTYGSADNPVAESSSDQIGSKQVSGVSAFLKNAAVVQTVAGESLGLDSGARIGVSGGTLSLNVPVAAAGALVVTNNLGGFEWKVADPTTEPWMPPAPGWVKVFEGLDLADIEVISSEIPAGLKTSGSGHYDPFHPRMVGGGLEVQLQQMPGQTLKVIKIRLEQDGADIKGQIVYARYCSKTDERGLGVDMDEVTDYTPYKIMTKYGDPQGLGVVELKVTRQKGVVEVRKPLSAVGTITVRNRTTLRLSGNQVADANGAFAAKVDVRDGASSASSGLLEVRDVPAISLTGALSGSYGNFTVERTADSPAADPIGDQTIEIADPSVYNNWVLVAANIPLRSLVGVTDVMMAGNNYSTTPNPVGTYYFRNNGGTASVFAEDPGTTVIGQKGVNKCCLIEFRQAIEGVKMRIRKTYYKRDCVNDGKGFDYDEYNMSGSGTVGTSTYCITKLTLQFDDGARPWFVSAYADNTSLWPSCRMTVRGAATRPQLLNWGRSLFAKANFFVESGACFASTRLKGELNSGTLTVCAGGVYLSGKNTLSGSQNGKLVIDGGVMVSGADEDSAVETDDNACYNNDLTLRNGGRIVHKRFRMGYNADVAALTVDGTSPSFIDTPIALCAKSDSAPSVWRLQVADTTGDGTATPDLTIAGGIGLYSAAKYSDVSVEKYGTGTVLMNGLNTYTRSTTIYEGAIKLGRSNTMKSTMPLVLAGGTLATAANVTNTVGALTIGADSSVEVGAGAELDFPAPTEWEDGAGLSVTQPEGSVFRIGTSACLTPAQVRCVKVNGHHVAQNDDGSFSPLGAVLIVR